MEEKINEQILKERREAERVARAAAWEAEKAEAQANRVRDKHGKKLHDGERLEGARRTPEGCGAHACAGALRAGHLEGEGRALGAPRARAVPLLAQQPRPDLAGVCGPQTPALPLPRQLCPARSAP